MTPVVALDLKRITAEVAARHGMLLRPDDPAMLLVTMNEVVLQQVIGSIEARTEEIVAGIEAGFRSAQREALGSVEREARKAGIAVREEIQKDIDAGRLHARELIVELNHAYTRSAVRRWVAIGVVFGERPSGAGCWFRSAACEGVEMRSFLAMLFYIDHKCDTQPAFRKTFLVFTLIFVFLLWSPWRPLLCPVFGVCPAPVVRADSAPQPKPHLRRVTHTKRIAPTPAPVQIPAEPSVQAAVQPSLQDFRKTV